MPSRVGAIEGIAECLTSYWTCLAVRPVLRSYQVRLSGFSELHNEITGRVLRPSLPPSLAPEANKGGFVDASPGTTIFVRDPAVMRKAVATADDTIVLAIGGPRDAAYRITPAASQDGFWDAYQAKDYAAALEAVNRGFEMYPGNAHLLYNVACMQALLGNEDAALAALAESVAQWELYKDQARKDDDFASLREDPRFVELVG